MGMGTRHNKRRNVGLVYELLVREVTAAAVGGDRLRGGRAVGLIDRHMGPRSVLGPELAAHRAAFSQRGCGPAAARRIVDELRAAGIRLSAKQAIGERAKTALIHETNRLLGRDLFDRHRIPDYKVHASIGMVLARGIGRRLEEGLDMVQYEEALVTWLASPVQESRALDRDATALAYGTAVNLFEDELGRELTAGQRDLLRERVRTDLGGSSEPFRRLMEKQRDDLRRRFESARMDQAFLADSEMGVRLDEAIRELRGPTPEPTDESLERLLLMHEVRREIES